MIWRGKLNGIYLANFEKKEKKKNKRKIATKGRWKVYPRKKVNEGYS